MAYPYHHSYGHRCSDVPSSPIFFPENIRPRGIPCYNGLPPRQHLPPPPPPPPPSPSPSPPPSPPFRHPQPRFKLQNSQFSHYFHRAPSAHSCYIPMLRPIPNRDNNFEYRPHPQGFYGDHRSLEHFDVENFGSNLSPAGDGRHDIGDRELGNGPYPFKEIEFGYQCSDDPFKDGFGRNSDTFSYLAQQNVHRGVANDNPIRNATVRHVQYSKAATSTGFAMHGAKKMPRKTAFRRIQNHKGNWEDKCAWYSSLCEDKDSKLATGCKMQEEVKLRSSLHLNMASSKSTVDFDNGLKHKISNIQHPSVATENFFLVNPIGSTVNKTSNCKKGIVSETSSSCHHNKRLGNSLIVSRRASSARDLKKKNISRGSTRKLAVPNRSSLNSQSTKMCSKSKQFREVGREVIIPNSDSQSNKWGKTKKLDDFAGGPRSSTDLNTVVATDPAAVVPQEIGYKDVLLVANKDEIEGSATATVLKNMTSISDTHVLHMYDAKSTHGESISFGSTFNLQERAAFTTNDSTNSGTNYIILLDKSSNSMFSVSKVKDNPSEILNIYDNLEEPKLDSSKLEAIDMQSEHEGLSASCTYTTLTLPFKSSNQMDLKDFDDNDPKNVDLEPAMDGCPNLKRPVSVAFDTSECAFSPCNKRERKFPRGSESLSTASKIDDKHDALGFSVLGVDFPCSSDSNHKGSYDELVMSGSGCRDTVLSIDACRDDCMKAVCSSVKVDELAVSNPQLPEFSKSTADQITIPVPFTCGNEHDNELAFIPDTLSDGMPSESLHDVCCKDKISFEKPNIQYSSSLSATLPLWIAKTTSQPSKATDGKFHGGKIQFVSSIHPGSSSFLATASKTVAPTHKTKPQTWHRENQSFSSAPSRSCSLINSISSTCQVAKTDANYTVASYIRKGNSLVRKPALDAAGYQKSHWRNSIVYQLDPSGTMELEPKESADINGKSEINDSFGALSDSLIVKENSDAKKVHVAINASESPTTGVHQYDSDSAVLFDISNRDLNKNKALFCDGYFKKKNHQLIRNSSKSETSQTGDLHGERLNSEEQPDPDVIPVRRFAKRLTGKGVNTLLSQNHNVSWNLWKFVPILCPWKRATYWRTLKSDSNYGRNLMQSRKKNSVYTRPKHVFSPRKSKILCVGGSSLMPKKAVKEDAMEIAATGRNKRKQCSASSTVSQINNTLGEQIFRIGLVSYRMDPSGQTLQRISDGELSGSEGSQEEKRTRTIFVPRRLVIGNDEYVRIGNGNQLIRDPKRRIQSLASEKLRWSLHTARSRLAKKWQYCQFFTRFGKCNKKNGKCPFLHDSSKIVVCTKFLNDSCFDSDCKLTHEIIPERMPDCSFFLQGLCTNTICPYRHVHVNPNASTCDGFLRGYCTRGNECTKKHTYVCPDYEAGRYCPHGSKCKLHHPKDQSRGKERKKRSHPKTNEIGRYFGADNIDVSDSDLAVLDNPSSSCNFSQDCGADHISVVAGDGEEAEEQSSSSDEETRFAGADPAAEEVPAKHLCDLDELIKPIRIMNIGPRHRPL